ncbi:MAG: metal-dependent transcriptional regulator [Candidatus Latescibacteria bacterium]|jgi:DtxR family transcriptional regulator, Mn-dependent transcriptional regulator|nr:metal-dependent transcriptional regulator [Candidatus Latescibacterota bacterium]MBT5831419.1 metal-dependent transcriptional regulator [Candidatus Latescibacterota bacterium]
MSAEVWKEYESNEISHSVAHHLAAIYELMRDQGYARVSDVARALDITRGSASLTLKALKAKGLVVEDHNKFLKLSEEGKGIVDAILGNRAIVRKFLKDVLKLDEQRAEIDACKVEHLLSAQTGVQLLHFVRFLFSADPIAKQFLTEFWERSEEDILSGDLLESVTSLLDAEK